MKKILIIDDDQLVSNIYRNKLATNGFEVEIASDGERGIAMVQSFKPDLVILDLMLPKITGIELLKQIRAGQDSKTLPVVVFSNTYLSNLVQEAWKAGATKCLSKASATPKQLIEVVRAATAKAAASAAATAAQTNATAPGGAQPSSAFADTGKSSEAAPVPMPAAQKEDLDGSYQVDLLRSFGSSAPGMLTTCRNQLQAAAKTAEETVRTKSLLELYRLIHNFTGNAGIAGFISLAQVSDALEALLKELCDKPKNINASTLRTIASTLDFLGLLVQEATKGASCNRTEIISKPNILVVDDEAISRRAVTYALEKAKLPCTSVESPEEASALLAEHRYDLVFLDVDMPRMNGYELCTKLRTLETNKKTPVVFVTSLNGFENRANSIMAGGNDLIAKPFLFMELALKALVYILKGRLQASPAPAATPSSPAPQPNAVPQMAF